MRPRPRLVRSLDAIEDRKDQLSSKDGHIEAVRKSIPELDGSVKKATEIRQKQHAEYMTGCSQC